jgi:hypothetical protein
MHIPLLSSLFLSPFDALHSVSNQLVYALFASSPFVSQPEYLIGLGIAFYEKANVSKASKVASMRSSNKIVETGRNLFLNPCKTPTS